ncbi:MAG: transcriptional regulator [Phycisphaerae bacterium]|nr:transcriptional regulator [Phycisphaerae bacterium]
MSVETHAVLQTRAEEAPVLEESARTTTKKEMVERIAASTNQSRTDVKRTIQAFLDEVIEELGRGNRLEFRDFGVFEIRERAARRAQNPKTLERVEVPARRTVKFKTGRLMKVKVEGSDD